MDRTAHILSVCTSCRHAGSECRPGRELIAQLRAAMSVAYVTVSEEFEVSGVAAIADCDRPCTTAYHATAKATYLFGDVDPDEDIGDLLAFARQYCGPKDGWCSSITRSGKLPDAKLARRPAALIIATMESVQ